MNVLLDSTALIDALRKKPACLEALESLVATNGTLATSAINVGEVYAGLRPNEEKRAQDLLSGMEVQSVTASIAKLAGELKQRAARKGVTLELDDMVVAATAMELGYAVWTENTKDFAVPGLVLYRP
jgi:predicted nucleic acid-binding protein